jgi:GNAT superfamily N-acetyltransferase
MQIENAIAGDIDVIFELYDKAIEFQKTVFDKHWLGFDVELVNQEIEELRLWKIVEDGQIACLYTVTYADPMIWKEKSNDAAMYIHRIVTNPGFRGRGYAKVITEWAKEFGRSRGLRFVRMDTWGDNQKLLNYYQDCGFKLLGIVTPESTDGLPQHYRGLSLSLLEIDLQA